MRSKTLLWAGVLILFTSQSRADAVLDWNATAMTVMLRVPTLARNSTLDLAYLHIAIYDAVNAIDDEYAVFAVVPSNAAPWASREAATAAAARRVLLSFYAPEQQYIDSVYAAALALLPDDSTKTRGIEIGDTVATRFLALRAGDGRDAVATYTWLPPAPGVYQPTPPGAAEYQPINVWLPQVKPFSLISSSQFRAPAPPALTSNTYARDFDEVKAYGSADSSLTTAAQREMARFHTENPAVQGFRNIRQFVISRNMSISENARFFAQMYVAINDAGMTGFESKYYYNAWRPSTAIRGADGDDNPLTEADTTWLPLVATPRHPEYPAAHGVGNAAIAFTIERFFGRADIPVTFTSMVTGTSRSYSNVNELVTESVDARVYGGMHFRNSVEAGADIGRKVAQWVANRGFYKKEPEIPTAFLEFWFSADAGVDTLDGKVSRWHDLSGKGNDAIQANAARQPVLIPDALNGKPALRFDGVDDKLGFTAATMMTQFSLFLVINNHAGDPANAGHLLVFGAGGQFNNQFFMGMRQQYAGSPASGEDTLGMATGYSSGIEAIAPALSRYDQWRNISVVNTGTMWGTTLRRDGLSARMVSRGVNESISVIIGDAMGSGGGIGGADGVPVGRLLARCDVAEILVFNAALPPSTRLEIERALANKYGLLVGVAADQHGRIPETFALAQNFPNPFNPSTSIRYELPQASKVSLIVYNLLGQEVKTLVDEDMSAGEHEVKFNALNLASGVYLYRLRAGDFVETKRLVLLK